MRRPRCPAPLLPLAALLLLLAMHCAAGCLAAAPALRHRCDFDAAMRKSGPLPTAVVREVPRKGEGAAQAYTAVAAAEGRGEGEAWAPIRIVVSTEDLKDPSKYCNATGVERTDFKRGMVRCQERHVLTEEKRKMYESFLLPRAIKLHTDRLLVKPLAGALVVPRTLPFPCFLFKVPDDHKSTGVRNADMVLYAAAGPMASETVAVGRMCAVLEDGRPSVGVVNYNPAQMVEMELGVRILAHEIAHALGFGLANLKNRSLVSHKSAVRGKSSVMLVTGNNVKAKAIAHFNCSSLEGMELEDNRVWGVGSHWKRRSAVEELMAPTVGAGRYTALTMAAFADMGYYRVNWDMAEPMRWGNGTGCDFLQKKCTELGSPGNAYPHMLCDASDNTTLRCTSDRHHVGRCTGFTLDGNGDKCPFVSPFFVGPSAGGSARSRCSDAGVTSLPGSLTGRGSWCLDAESLQVKSPRTGDAESGGVSGVCAQVQCGGDGTVQVKYLGSDAWHACPEGGEVEVAASAHFESGGKIKCPKFAEVCTVAADGSGFPLAGEPEGLQRANAGPPHTFSGGVLPWARSAYAYVTGADGSAAAAGSTSLALLAVATAAVAMLPL